MKARRWLEPVTTAWTGVVTHKLRSFLTMLGIVIGVGAVITLMSVGKGSEAQILSRIRSMGSNLITIRPGAVMSGGVRGAPGGVTTLTAEDAQAIAEQVANVSAVAPYYSINLQLVAGSANMNSQIYGVGTSHALVNNLKVAAGSFIAAEDYDRGARVAVLGSNVKQTLFGNSDPLGQQMRMGGTIVTVVGILETKGGMPGSPDDGVFIPLTAMQQTVSQPRTSKGDRVVSAIALAVAAEDKADQVVEEITSLLRTRHRLAAGADNDFNIMSMEEVASTLSETMGTMTLLLGAIAAISLLVGGIGVMNIMLVSVLERTREIGIRRALGASQRNIWGQFLIEASALTLAGGVIGVAGGIGVSRLISGLSGMATLVTPAIVVLAVSVSVAIGLFFGFYPAWNASRLDPIKALRSE